MYWYIEIKLDELGCVWYNYIITGHSATITSGHQPRRRLLGLLAVCVNFIVRLKFSEVIMGKKERAKRLVFAAEFVMSHGSGFCPECGVTPTDLEGLCISCGATAKGGALRALMSDIKLALE